MPITPKAFIFDCDGTLVNSMDAWLEAGPRLLASYGVATTSDDFAKYEPLSIEDECAAYHEDWGVGESGAELKTKLMAIMCDAYSTRVPAREGVHAFLDEVKAAGIPMCIATSTPRDAVSIGLEANGLRNYFSNITITEEAGVGKTHPDVYQLALKRLCDEFNLGELDPREVWVFEDAIFGLKSSGEAGYRRVGIYDSLGRHSRDEVIANCEIFIDEYPELSLSQILTFEA